MFRKKNGITHFGLVINNNEKYNLKLWRTLKKLTK